MPFLSELIGCKMFLRELEILTDYRGIRWARAEEKLFYFLSLRSHHSVHPGRTFFGEGDFGNQFCLSTDVFAIFWPLFFNLVRGRTGTTEFGAISTKLPAFFDSASIAIFCRRLSKFQPERLWGTSPLRKSCVSWSKVSWMKCFRINYSHFLL